MGAAHLLLQQKKGNVKYKLGNAKIIFSAFGPADFRIVCNHYFTIKRCFDYEQKVC